MTRLTKAAAAVFLCGTAAAAETWPPKPLLREKAPNIMQLDEQTALCEVQWDGYRDNGNPVDISGEAEDWVEGVVVAGSGEAIFIHSEPVQVFARGKPVTFTEDGEKVTLTLTPHPDNQLELNESREAAGTVAKNSYWGRVICP